MINYHLPRVLLAAPMSGSGKTTLAAGLIAAFAARGLAVAPFKCGPDYIDPSYHALAAGRPAFNLDAWLVPPDAIPGVLARRSHGASLAVIEGVMGLFDGYAGSDDTGSSAHIARLTRTPVIIVLDIRAMARTAAALISGLQRFDPQVNVAGVILNRAGSDRHSTMVREAIESTTGLPVLGALGRDQTIGLPERHLGLVPTAEPGRWHSWLAELRTLVEAQIDLDRLLALAHTAPPLEAPTPSDSRFQTPAKRPIIAVARDEAFSFFYEDNLDLLRRAGGEIVFFSPLHDQHLPDQTTAIYLGGGFPELYAAQLSDNQTMRTAVQVAAQNNMPIYAECGGLMYLTEAVIDNEGQRHAMAGVLPGLSEMTSRLTLGYRTVRAETTSWLWHAGEIVRGHEFHYSQWNNRPADLAALYTCLPDTFRRDPWSEGGQCGQVLASYIHIHWLSCPHIAERFVSAAQAYQQTQHNEHNILHAH